VYRIGDFARLGRMSVRTLRYYDEIGLFKPVEVDDSTGYRYYLVDQLSTLRYISAFKEAGLSLEDIAVLIGGKVTRNRIRSILLQKKGELKLRLKEEKKHLERLEILLRQIEEEEKYMSPTPKEMRVEFTFDDGSKKQVKYDLSPLRSGDNPHQAGFVGEPGSSYTEVIEGRGMGFTNHIDLLGYAVAVEISKTMAFLGDKRQEAVVINKHTNPAVYASRSNQLEALKAALATDTKSPFGGVMSTSSKLTKETSDFLVEKNKTEKFVLDVLAAPGFEKGCTESLGEVMKNLRIIDVSPLDTWEKILAGVLGYNMKWTVGGKPVITEVDRTSFFNAKYGMEVLSKRKPTKEEMNDAHLAWIGAKAIQSNSFAFCKDAVLLCQCGGQTNREDSAKFAIERADEFKLSLKNCAAATDSFIFDRTAIDILHAKGVTTVVHPTRKLLTTGSLKPDRDIADVVDANNMIMIRPYLIGVDGSEKAWRVFRHL
jgi:AICAR transformylase/IMP cyclohydrolase PurH